jgi:CheY-like chemotaxis protein
MSKRVLDVGNCSADHARISVWLKRTFRAEVVRAHGPADALAALRDRPFDLVLVNRLLDRDGSEGLEIIQTIKATPELAAVPVMLITNYPEHQERAVAAGAELGFGKAELGTAEAQQKLAPFLL